MEKFNKYEKARIIGARALQIAMGAPILIDRGEELNPVNLAKKEFEADVIPINVFRKMPEHAVGKRIDSVVPVESASEEAEGGGESEGE